METDSGIILSYPEKFGSDILQTLQEFQVETQFQNRANNE